MKQLSRRQFMKTSVVSVAAIGVAEATTKQPNRSFHPASEAGSGVKVACSTAAWRKGGSVSLRQALAGIAAAGYTWVELDSDDLWDYRERPDDFKALLSQHGLGLVTVSVFGNFADREQRLKNISRAVLSARAIQELGSGILVLEGEWGDVPRKPRNYNTYSSNLSEVGALVYEETGLHCAYRFREKDAGDVRKIIATSDSRYTKFCFDTQYLTQLGIDPVPMIKTYGQRVAHIHLRDGENAGDTWRDVPIGTGKIAPAPILAALCDSGYDGWVTIQQDNVRQSPEKDAIKSLQNVQKQLEAAVSKSKVTVASNTPPQQKMNHSPSTSRGMLQGLVMISAAASLTPFSFFKTASMTPQDNSNPSQQMTHDMHSHRNRPVAPLPPTDPNFQPLFFSAEEYRDVSALADTIIPVTDTPGALDAHADEYADLMLWLEEENHDATSKQMGRFRELCSAHYGKPFASLTPEQRTEFLKTLTGGSVSPEDRPALGFFNQVRSLTVHAYYASPQGLLQDLGYKGNTYVAEFIGCTHPEHQR